MSLTTSNFTIEQLESRFEMQCMSEQEQYYMEARIDDGRCSGGSYDYYGGSWGNEGSGDGYTGVYQGDGSGNGQLDDGTYTDQSTGEFPAYGTKSNVSFRTWCRICRCRF